MLQSAHISLTKTSLLFSSFAAICLIACAEDATTVPSLTPAAPTAGSGTIAAPNSGVAGALAVPSAPTTPAMTAPQPGVAMPMMPATTPATTPASAAGAAAPAMNPPAIMPPPAAAGGAPPITVSIKIPNVQPGDEDTQCMQVMVPTSEVVNVTRVHNTLSQGSHHFILTAVTDAAAKEAPMAHCSGFRAAIKGAPLTITQKHDDQIELPEGIAYKLNAKQILHLELHYINTSDKPLDIVATANLYPAAAGANLQEAAVLLVGTADINVPAHMTKETAPKFLKLPAGMDGVKFYAITGHTHRFGTRVKVSTATGANAPGTLLYDPERFDWEAPEMKHLQPMATIPNGGGFMLQCSWNNTSDETLTWGESALKEMCFFWGYYFPRKPVVSIVIDNLDPKIIQTL